MQIGRRIYYEIATGNVILDTGERQGAVVPTTIEQDFQTYRALAERVPETVGVLELQFGEYAADFAACNGYRVDVSGETPTLVFSYPDPNQPPEAPPVYQRSLSEQIEELRAENLTAFEAIAELYEMFLAAQAPEGGESA